MTENQEKELFNILSNLVAGVREIRKVQDEHSAKLDEHSAKLDEHSAKLDEHSAKLDEHSAKLDKHSAKLDKHSARFDKLEDKIDLVLSRTNDIAKTVIVHENRLTTVEKDIAEIRSSIH